jgi:hypothetical protein
VAQSPEQKLQYCQKKKKRRRRKKHGSLMNRTLIVTTVIIIMTPWHHYNDVLQRPFYLSLYPVLMLTIKKVNTIEQTRKTVEGLTPLSSRTYLRPVMIKTAWHCHGEEEARTPTEWRAPTPRPTQT